MLPFYEAETDAIHSGDPAARAPRMRRAAAEVMGRIMLAELVRRGVLAPPSGAHRPLRSD